MATITTTQQFAEGNQVTAFTLNSIATGSVFATTVVDNISTQLTTNASGQSNSTIIVRDSGITTDKLETSDSQTTGVTLQKIQFAPANTVIVRDANSEGHFSTKALATTQILIGNGAGFTATSLSGDVTMTNAGVVTIGSDAVESGMLNDNIISGQTALSSGLSSSDEFLISDGGTIKKMDVSVLTSYNASLSETLTNKTLTSPVINSSVSGTAISTSDSLGSSDTTLSSTGAIKTYVDNQILASKQALYPVGSIFISANTGHDTPTNVANALGFGTWTAYGAGKAIVGKASSGTFNSLGNVSEGEETVTLADGEVPVRDHKHFVAKSGEVQFSVGDVTSSTSVAAYGHNGSESYNFRKSGNSFVAPDVGLSSIPETNPSVSAHNNIQPSIVVYMWKRTN